MKVCIVAGARPNFIKVAPIIRAIHAAKVNGKDIDFDLVYTGEESDKTLEESLFTDLSIPRPDAFLGVECERMNELTGRVMFEFDKYLDAHPADVVIVVDDLASTMAVSIVSKKRGLMLAHLVAGTRSFDINMPKEINRLVIDGLSDLLFIAGAGANNIVAREGAETSRVYMVGNILIDTLRFNYTRMVRPDILSELNLVDGDYIVFTLNRKALIAHPENLQKMLTAMIQNAAGSPIVAPLRADAAAAVKSCLGSLPAHFHLVSPLSYLEFGYLTAHARGIVTDSGNVAEEATFNRVPCITLNSYTEHQETVTVGSNLLVGEDADKLGKAVKDIVSGTWKKCAIPERWDGRSAERIVSILLENK
ncbi:MAG: non-hydrolyzing UDP-N-acetylglucosamine 2-epimerase [Hoylesella marshii]|jgi:UDP-N-acetylglucosamine 2-epimerase|uniref:non-hydrolyzing UDP-N-acetylglucosamine 2-epimerase n=1 Tax=Hoylesella marshii TaxID=189722 RepID=UPI003F9F6BFA